LVGGTGNDYLEGGTGNDTYVFNAGDGQDTIYDNGSTGDLDTLALGSGIAPANVAVAQGNSGNDLVLSINGTSDKVTLSGRVDVPWHSADQVLFADGTLWDYNTLLQKSLAGTANNDWLGGDSGANTLDGGAGNDTLSGRNGDDTYVFGRGYGSDSIDEEGPSSSANDRVLFTPDVAVSDVTFSRSGTNLVVRINGTTDQLTIIDGLWSLFNDVNNVRDKVELFDFADGTRITLASIQLALLSGTSGA